MENRLLAKIQTDVNQRKHIRNNFLSEVSHTIKILNFNHQNWSDVFVQERIFLFQTEQGLKFLRI